MKNAKQLKQIYKQHPGYQKDYFKLLTKFEAIFDHHVRTDLFDRRLFKSLLKKHHNKGAEFDIFNDIEYYLDENDVLNKVIDGIEQRAANQQFDYVANYALVGQNLQDEYRIAQRSGFKHLYYSDDYLMNVYNCPSSVRPLTNNDVLEQMYQYNDYVIEDNQADK